MKYELTNNTDDRQYEFHIDGLVPKIEYIRAGEKIYLTHTEVPKELEGKGVASALVKQVLENIQQNSLKLVPLCPFVLGYIKRHPEWESLIFKD